MNRSDHYKKVLKLSGYAISGVFIIWFVVSPIDKSDKSTDIGIALYRRFASIIAFVGIFWLLYYNLLWRWRWKFFRQIFFDQPILSGTWMGYLKSDFLKDGKPLPPIKIAFFIRQPNFFDIRITSMSSSHAFFSFGEVIDFDPSNNMIRLLYQYSQKQTLPDYNNDHQGAADLLFFENYLAGHYWTIVKTGGFIRVHKLSNKCYQSFEEADRLFGKKSVLDICYTLVQGQGSDER